MIKASIMAALLPVLDLPLPPAESKVKVGVYESIYRPINKAPLSSDQPIVHPLKNFYQLDQRYADLFDMNGNSQICGPAAMGNALTYLRDAHTPRFPRILEDTLPNQPQDDNMVRALFALCQTDRDDGTLVRNLLDCGKDALEEGDYPTQGGTYIRGIHSADAGQLRAPHPDDMRNYSKSRPLAAASINYMGDSGVVLLVGWYTVVYDWGQKAWVYQRNGGHYVTLAGYDAKSSNVFYVSNPLVDYSGQGRNYSRVSFEAIVDRPDIKTPLGFKNLWQSRDLVGGNLAVLEDLVVVLPKRPDLVLSPSIR